MNGDDASFQRSENQFFHQDLTKQAIVDLAKVESLVIYCGAGVTIDRTGISWARLITLLLRAEVSDEEDSGPHRPEPTDDQVGQEVEALCERLGPLQLASILAELSQQHRGTEKNALNSLVPKMRNYLYKHNGWQSGVLVRNIIRLAVGFIELQRRVVIVTTNYDDYLEAEFAEYCRELTRNMRAKGATAPDLPGIQVRALGRNRPLADRKGKGSLGQLEVVYLHGRISRAGRRDGRLVLSERDYHSTHTQVIAELKELFGDERTGLLVLGASMTDPPLLAALATTHGRGSRYALIPAEATQLTSVGPQKFAHLKAHLALRGKHFSTKFLLPDFHYQIAQFCEEVLTSVGFLPAAPDSYLDESHHLRYGLRLVAWWQRWHDKDEKRGAGRTYDMLADGLRGIKTTVFTGRNVDAQERMKIEMWVRNKPFDNRQLALWASSAGVLMDRSVLRTEELSLATTNASVKAFIEGQPQYISSDKLLVNNRENPSEASRWRTFLSVPIRVELSDDNVPVGLPVGVLTLATTADKRESVIPFRSTAEMEQLVDIVRNLGTVLLQA